MLLEEKQEKSKMTSYLMPVLDSKQGKCVLGYGSGDGSVCTVSLFRVELTRSKGLDMDHEEKGRDEG